LGIKHGTLTFNESYQKKYLDKQNGFLCVFMGASHFSTH
jgi:hypothetical protein